jgi:hypothetical protein
MDYAKEAEILRRFGGYEELEAALRLPELPRYGLDEGMRVEAEKVVELAFALHHRWAAEVALPGFVQPPRSLVLAVEDVIGLRVLAID